MGRIWIFVRLIWADLKLPIMEIPSVVLGSILGAGVCLVPLFTLAFLMAKFSGQAVKDCTTPALGVILLALVLALIWEWLSDRWKETKTYKRRK